MAATNDTPPPSTTTTSSTDTAAGTNDASTTTSSSSSSGNNNKGVAGRINYAQWDKVATDLVEETEREAASQEAEQAAQLGLNGKYARSQAEADERQKAQDVQQLKQKLDSYQQREQALVMVLPQLLGPVASDDDDKATTAAEAKTTEPTTVRITRQTMDAGTRVLRLTDTAGQSLQDTIVLTQDLSLLESKMAANAQAKSYPADAENAVVESPQQQRSIFGVIKAFLHNVHHCTVLIKCKLISGTIELHQCSNVVVKVQGPQATVATVQADQSSDIVLEFHDAPSGKNTPLPHQTEPTLYWGQDADDRIFHAGVSNLTVRTVRDGVVDLERTADYLRDGAVAVGNATPEEYQFVTSVSNDNGQLTTEAVVRTGSTTGSQVRAMTQRELAAEQAQRQKAAALALSKAEDMIRITDKDGNPVVTKTEPTKTTTTPAESAVAEEEEVASPEIQAVVDECLLNKSRGNEAFGAGEYGQAILLYSLALDKADELPPSSSNNATTLFPRDVVFSNRAACFLKLGQHEKAAADAQAAVALNPQNVKALFRQGLALHAMQQYRQALPLLAQALKLEPQNKQIKQALQFCEVRLEQEQRQRMQG